MKKVIVTTLLLAAMTACVKEETLERPAARVREGSRNREGSVDDVRAETLCGASVRGSYFYNRPGCGNDYEVSVSLQSYVLLYRDAAGEWHEPRIELKVWGKKRSVKGCGWSPYVTRLGYRSVSYSIPAWKNVDGEWVSYHNVVTIPDYYTDDDRLQLVVDEANGEAVLNQIITTPMFTSLHAEGTSSDANGHWAAIGCP